MRWKQRLKQREQEQIQEGENQTRRGKQDLGREQMIADEVEISSVC